MTVPGYAAEKNTQVAKKEMSLSAIVYACQETGLTEQGQKKHILSRIRIFFQVTNYARRL